MSAESVILQLVIWLPALGAALIPLYRDNPRAPRWIAALTSGIVLALSLVLFASFDPGAGFQFVVSVPWIPAINSFYAVGLDGISLPLVVLNALLTFLAVLISWNITLRPALYFGMFLVLETAVMGVFSSLDLFLFFLFWELELAPMFLIIGIWGSARREYAAYKFILYTIAGSAFMLVGILLLYFWSGNTFSIPELGQAARGIPLGAAMLIFVLLYIGFAVKIPVWPFHTWLPDAHTEAPTAGSVLLAGVLLKMGAYGLLRVAVNLLPSAAEQFQFWLALLAVVNILYGAALALAQVMPWSENQDLKRLIANSSISHMGFVLLGIAALTQVGIAGAVLNMISHGVITGLLFAMVGLLYDRTHTRDLRQLGGGLAPKMPIIAVVFTIAALASLGLPGMSGFVAEFMVFLGSFPVWQTFTVLGVFAIVLTAGYLLWMVLRVFQGPLPERWAEEKLSDASGLETLAVGTFVAATLLIGLYPNVVLSMITAAVAPIAGLFAS